MAECKEWVYDRSVFTETISTEFDLVCGQNTFVSILGTIYMIGVLLGSLFGGFFNDKFGRKKARFYTNLTMLPVSVEFDS